MEKKDMTGSFKKGIQNGEWKYWFRTGELSYIANFIDGKKHGTWTYFYRNGKKYNLMPLHRK